MDTRVASAEDTTAFPEDSDNIVGLTLAAVCLETSEIYLDAFEGC